MQDAVLDLGGGRLGGFVGGYKRSVGQKIGSVGLGGARSAGSQRILRISENPLKQEARDEDCLDPGIGRRGGLG